MNSRNAQSQNQSIVASVAKDLQDSVRGSLRILERGKSPREISPNPIGCENEQVPLCYGMHGGLQLGQVVANHAASQQEGFLRRLFVSTHQHAMHISDTQPGHQAVAYVYRSNAQDHPACCPESFVAGHHQGDNRSEEHTSELQSQSNLVCRLLLEKKKKKMTS